MKVQIKKGRNLSKKELETISKEIEINFEESSRKSLKRLEEEKESLFFILKNKREILSFGFLRQERITIGQEHYNIFGIRNIISIKKNKGYGTKLMRKILTYLKRKKITGLGFTGSRVAQFYKRVGFSTRKGFRYKLFPDYKRRKDQISNWAFYIEGEDGFIGKVIKTKSKIRMSRRKW